MFLAGWYRLLYNSILANMQIQGKGHYENIPHVVVLFNIVFQIIRIPGEKATLMATV